MTDKVTHRGPDAEGYLIDGSVALGHRRLSIIDLSPAGNQPMRRRDVWITFNGEIYNYVELRKELTELGYVFTSGSDTEVILHAYLHWGVEAFSKLNGMWAFVIYDRSRGELILCRDHFGIKPLYYANLGDWFVAGSEIKQFTSFDSFEPILNKKVTINFLAKGLLNYSEETFFEGVKELRPGHFMTYSLTTHTFRIEKWYELNPAIKSQTDSYETAVARVRDLFLESVRIRMRSDVRVGSCLSGGVDSSSIVSVIHGQQMANPDFAAITSCYEDKKYDEQFYSDEVIKQTGFKTSKIYPDLNQLLNDGHLDKMVFHQDQPFSTASHYSEFSVFQQARKEKMIVMQDGQGSDEFLCGYPEFFTARMMELIRSFQWGDLFRHLTMRAAHRKTSLWIELKALGWNTIGNGMLLMLKHLSGRSSTPWLIDSWNEKAKALTKDFRASNIRDLSIQEMVYTSIPYQLHSEDRNSMLFSIESRLPFLDHRLVEYCIGLPSEYKIRDGYAKAILRDAVRELPTLIRERKDKMGFVAPDSTWMKSNSKQVRADLEEAVNNLGIFSQELLVRFDRFVNGSLGYEPIYFRAMTLNRFCKIFKMEIRGW